MLAFSLESVLKILLSLSDVIPYASFLSDLINVHFTSEIKDIFNKKHLNFLFIIF